MRSLEYFGEWMFHAAASSRSRFWLKDSMFIGVPGLDLHSILWPFLSPLDTQMSSILRTSLQSVACLIMRVNFSC
jgi:hypothetical protein